MCEDAAATEQEPFALPEFVRVIIECVAKPMRADQGHWTLGPQFHERSLGLWFGRDGPAGATDRSPVGEAMSSKR